MYGERDKERDSLLFLFHHGSTHISPHFHITAPTCSILFAVRRCRACAAFFCFVFHLLPLLRFFRWAARIPDSVDVSVRASALR